MTSLDCPGCGKSFEFDDVVPGAEPACDQCGTKLVPGMTDERAEDLASATMTMGEAFQARPTGGMAGSKRGNRAIIMFVAIIVLVGLALLLLK